MRTFVAGFGMRLPLGKRGENLAVQVQIPVVKEWKAQYGEGTFQLVNKRPDEENVYACVITWDDQNVLWNITNTEVAIVGNGQCELQYYVGDTLAKSYSWTTIIQDTLYDDGTTPPEPWESWVEQVLQAGSEAVESAAAAAISAENADKSADEASDSATAAEQSATDSESSAQDSEAWAVGQRNGVDVPPEDETYENNSKYYAAQAEASVAAGQYFGFLVDDDGVLYVTKTPDAENLDFQIDQSTGNLEVVFL